MIDEPQKRQIVLGMPGYGNQTAAAGYGLWNACRDMTTVDVRYQAGSLLACNFNTLLCYTLTKVHRGERVDYWAMLHDDVGPEAYWLDVAIEEMEANDLDALGVVVPIKDQHGTTSIALHHDGDNWNPECRLTMRDVYELPETFTSDDLAGQKILLNTGCLVVKWNQEWCRTVHFTINDRIVFDIPQNRYRPEVESEDWFFSRLLYEIGMPGHPLEGIVKPLRIGATRKIAINHQGVTNFTNTHPWGTDVFDHECPQRKRRVSPVPGAFPADIHGWLTRGEAKALENLARGKRVLEIGSYCGLSTIVMARVAYSVTACDYFDGRATPEPRDTRADFDRNIERYGVADRVQAVHPDSFNDLSPDYDVAFIDGAHDYDSVAADAIKAMNLLAPGGLLVFHDYKCQSHPGIERVIDDLLLDGGELISTTETVAVVKPPARILQEV